VLFYGGYPLADLDEGSKRVGQGAHCQIHLLGPIDRGPAHGLASILHTPHFQPDSIECAAFCRRHSPAGLREEDIAAGVSATISEPCFTSLVPKYFSYHAWAVATSCTIMSIMSAAMGVASVRSSVKRNFTSSGAVELGEGVFQAFHLKPEIVDVGPFRAPGRVAGSHQEEHARKLVIFNCTS
jgi:hypothetical protein